MLSKLRSWGRGTTVPHHKSTTNMTTVTMPLPEKVYLSMQQHIGAPSVPTVKKGDTVYVGTVVGKAGGFVGADIHSSVSGTVVSVEPVTTHTGNIADCVIVEPDGQQTIDASIVPPTVRDKETFLAAIKACGLVGLGGAGFPSSVKLAPKNPEKIDTLVINAAECEPYITSDNREIIECSDSILSGIMACKKYLNIPKVIIGIERNKPEAMDLLFSLTAGDPELEVCPLPAHYPQGAEKVLIQTATSREVPGNGLPADIGVLVLNVTTVSAIGKYLASGIPLISKRLTVDGGCIANPQNVEVPIGTPVKDVVAFCGGFTVAPSKILMGGPMMGVALIDTSVPIVKQNNAILALTEKESLFPTQTPCIRCGRCVMSCPVNLSPIEIKEAYDKQEIEVLQDLHAEVCMGCGVCSYVCPAKIPLSPVTTLSRQLVIKQARKS